MNNCCICLHVGMAPGKISCTLTGKPSLNTVCEFNLIEFHIFVKLFYLFHELDEDTKSAMQENVHSRCLVFKSNKARLIIE